MYTFDGVLSLLACLVMIAFFRRLNVHSEEALAELQLHPMSAHPTATTVNVKATVDGEGRQ
jgi:hypothetical protein